MNSDPQMRQILPMRQILRGAILALPVLAFASPMFVGPKPVRPCAKSSGPVRSRIIISSR